MSDVYIKGDRGTGKTTILRDIAFRHAMNQPVTIDLWSSFDTARTRHLEAFQQLAKERNVQLQFRSNEIRFPNGSVIHIVTQNANRMNFGFHANIVMVDDSESGVDINLIKQSYRTTKQFYFTTTLGVPSVTV